MSHGLMKKEIPIPCDMKMLFFSCPRIEIFSMIVFVGGTILYVSTGTLRGAAREKQNHEFQSFPSLSECRNNFSSTPFQPKRNAFPFLFVCGGVALFIRFLCYLFFCFYDRPVQPFNNNFWFSLFLFCFDSTRWPRVPWPTIKSIDNHKSVRDTRRRKIFFPSISAWN